MAGFGIEGRYALPISKGNKIFNSNPTIIRLSMYLVIRCPGCRTFMYIDRFQKWRLCPSCGESINCRRAPVYIEVRDHIDAESIVNQLEIHLHRTGKQDLSPSEVEKLRHQYATWIRERES